VKTLIRCYALVFGFMHTVAPFLGLRIVGLSELVSFCAMFLFAILCFLAIGANPRPVNGFLAFGWGVSVMVEWLHLIQWAPAFTDLQYIVMALLNMGMALGYAYLSDSRD
jgi:hypothetical protein